MRTTFDDPEEEPEPIHLKGRTSMAKHDEYDNQEGLDPKVKADINKAVRANARQAKANNAQTKASNENGNGGRR